MKPRVMHVVGRLWWPGNETELRRWAENWNGEITAIYPTAPANPILCDLRFASITALANAVRFGLSNLRPGLTVQEIVNRAAARQEAPHKGESK